ncbi:hypothetical protein BJ138DRAFT_1154242 [Hygrophoropsis aurantiaca]|uniref:Uncharacterized protein n=1 Tax=Hygrophoropsis aurantiaca TaxID=72124 RepID=A0ACB8A9X3_9AGAM|nr:hypothetical protein BJ138DRAFT_1154242 [Hygrophoropsis aurantiaca]
MDIDQPRQTSVSAPDVVMKEDNARNEGEEQIPENVIKDEDVSNPEPTAVPKEPGDPNSIISANANITSSTAAGPAPSDSIDSSSLQTTKEQGRTSPLNPSTVVDNTIVQSIEEKQEHEAPTSAGQDTPQLIFSAASTNRDLPGSEVNRDEDTNMQHLPSSMQVSPPPRLPPVSYIEAHAQAEARAQAQAQAQPEAQAHGPNSAMDRPLNVTDALSYLDAVKMQFQDQPEVYNHFLDIMKDFKSQLIDTPGVIKRVSYLFNGHPSLIQGFNTFLPVGYRIECSSDPRDSTYITVTTPTGTMLQSSEGPGKAGIMWSTFPSLQGNTPKDPASTFATGSGSRVLDVAAGAEYAHPQSNLPSRNGSPDPSMYGLGLDGAAIEPAVQYVQKIKQRCDEATYRQFLEILGRYHQRSDAIDEREVSAEIARLFKHDPDLRSDFRIFMPEKSQALFDEAEESYVAPTRRTRPNTPLDGRGSRRKPEPSSALDAVAAVPQKRKRKATEREVQRDKERERDSAARAGPSTHKAGKQPQANGAPPADIAPPPFVPPPSPGRRSAHPHLHPHHPSAPHPAPLSDDTHFFDRVKRALNNRETFNEFLKLVNLFTQEFIDTARLVRESRNFLGDGELMRQFREILGWDEKRERERWLLEEQQAWSRIQGGPAPVRPGKIHSRLQVGSYRKMPASEANVTCSGRDEMCRSVLNDEWVSHPTWSSEDSGFVAHKKNIYEEALHRSEEERHEYDFHIEAIVRTISMLEPINSKIAQLSPEERGNFKLKPNLGGSGKSIHQRVVKKIYGREAGLEVLQAMQDSPALAIPVVLMRLKQKEEEWKRAQREWNKVWREVDARNYQKSLDHQGISFKTADKKSITAKAFVNQIEAARDEQMNKRACLIDPLFARTRPRQQLAFGVEDVTVLQDVVKMSLSLLDRTQGQINVAERKRIEGFLRTFVPLFFMIDVEVFNRAFVVVQENVGGDGEMNDDVSSAIDDVEMSSVASGSSSKAGSRSHRKGGGVSSGGDLRKKLLKSEQAKSTIRKTRAQEVASPSASRHASPAIPDTMQVDGAEESKAGGGGESSNSQKLPARKNVFFGNTVFYVLLRLLEVLYSRLHFFKALTVKIASDASNPHKPSPLANILGLPSMPNLAQMDDRSANAEHFYDLMLESCERLFDNEIDQNVFEEQMRYMFGVKEAYRLFTIDKVIGALIKQVQLALADPRSQELFELLKRDRALGSPTTQDQLNSRRFVENVMGPDENIFRIDWLQHSKTMTVQLLGKDDSSIDDSEALAERWQSYVDSFVSDDPTHGTPSARVKRPFLRKNLPANSSLDTPELLARGSLEIRVCVRTYRLFYVSHTEDFLWRISPTKDEPDVSSTKLNAKRAQQRIWMERVKAGEWPPAALV